MSARTSIIREIRERPNRDFCLKKRGEGFKRVRVVTAPVRRRRVSVLWSLLRDNRVFTPEMPIAQAA